MQRSRAPSRDEAALLLELQQNAVAGQNRSSATATSDESGSGGGGLLQMAPPDGAELVQLSTVKETSSDSSEPAPASRLDQSGASGAKSGSRLPTETQSESVVSQPLPSPTRATAHDLLSFAQSASACSDAAGRNDFSQQWIAERASQQSGQSGRARSGSIAGSLHQPNRSDNQVQGQSQGRPCPARSIQGAGSPPTTDAALTVATSGSRTGSSMSVGISAVGGGEPQGAEPAGTSSSSSSALPGTVSPGSGPGPVVATSLLEEAASRYHEAMGGTPAGRNHARRRGRAQSFAGMPSSASGRGLQGAVGPSGAKPGKARGKAKASPLGPSSSTSSSTSSSSSSSGTPRQAGTRTRGRASDAAAYWLGRSGSITSSRDDRPRTGRLAGLRRKRTPSAAALAAAGSAANLFGRGSGKRARSESMPAALASMQYARVCCGVLEPELALGYNEDGRIGVFDVDQRRALLKRFHDKRKRRVWSRKVRYNCRKKLADKRVRVKGRFVRTEEQRRADLAWRNATGAGAMGGIGGMGRTRGMSWDGCAGAGGLDRLVHATGAGAGAGFSVGYAPRSSSSSSSSSPSAPIGAFDPMGMGLPPQQQQKSPVTPQPSMQPNMQSSSLALSPADTATGAGARGPECARSPLRTPVAGSNATVSTASDFGCSAERPASSAASSNAGASASAASSGSVGWSSSSMQHTPVLGPAQAPSGSGLAPGSGSLSGAPAAPDPRSGLLSPSTCSAGVAGEGGTTAMGACLRRGGHAQNEGSQSGSGQVPMK